MTIKYLLLKDTDKEDLSCINSREEGLITPEMESVILRADRS